MSFYNKFNLLNATNDGEMRVDENTALFSIHELIFKSLLNKTIVYDKYYLAEFIDGCEFINGVFNQRHYDDPDYEIHPISHDNLTAISAFSYKYGYTFHKSIWGNIHNFQYNDPRSPEKRFVHPRDWIFIGILNNSILAKLARPVLLLTMVWSILRQMKGDLIHTDGKLLSFVRCYCADLTLEWWILKKLIKFNMKCSSFIRAFEIYFPDNKHLLSYLNNTEVKNYMEES